MRAHIIENGIVANTIEVESLGFMPGLVSAESGGSIGDRYVDGQFVKPEPPAKTTEEIQQDIASRRYDEETAGIDLMGIHIDTGRDSQALITGATVQAMLDPNYSLRWKTVAGFVDLTAEQIIAVATAARGHVQACFNREAELLEALEAGTFTPEMLEEGWPNEPVPESAPS